LGDDPDLNRAFKIRTKLGFYDANFDFDETNIDARIDLGLKSVNTHWLNPYIRWQMPPRSSYFTGAFAPTLGAIFHFRPSSQQFWLRYQGELRLGGSQPSEPPVRPTLQLTHSWTHGWRNLRLGLLECWDLTNEFSRTQQLSASIEEKHFQGFAQADLGQNGELTNLELIGSFQPKKDARLYTRINKELVSKNKELDLAVGADYVLSKGFGAKVVYFQNDKFAATLNFTLNKTFSGSFLFDVGCQ
jgi:hypothetical protein